MSPSAIPVTLHEDVIDDLLYSARANDIQDFKTTLKSASEDCKAPPLRILAAAVDEYSLNTPVHYAAANGHLDILQYISNLETTEGGERTGGLFELASKENDAGNTPIHYAALNGQLGALKTIVPWLDRLSTHHGTDVERKKMKMDVLTRRNRAGKDAAFEAVGYLKEDVVVESAQEEKAEEDTRKNETEAQRRGREERKRKEDVYRYLLEEMGVGDKEEEKEDDISEAAEEVGNLKIQGDAGERGGTG